MMSWEYCWTDRSPDGIGSRCLSSTEFLFDGLSCGKFPISVWLGARGPGMKFTHFPDRCSASSTRYSQNLLRGEFLGFHRHMMQRCTSRKMFTNAQVRHIDQVARYCLTHKFHS